MQLQILDIFDSYTFWILYGFYYNANKRYNDWQLRTQDLEIMQIFIRLQIHLDTEKSCSALLSTMLSDLSPGDKLSLKGKIFELQKKLQIIDYKNKQKQEFSYKPKLFNYDLPDRESNVLESINKAEIIRKVSYRSVIDI